MTAQVWVDYSCWWSTSACLTIFLQAVLFSYFPPTHLVSRVCQAGRREKTPGSFICRQQGYGKRRQDSKFLLSIFFSSPGSQTSHHLILPLGHGIALQPKHCLLFSCCHWHHYRPWCSFIFLYQVSVLSLGPRFPKPANDNECLNLVKCGGTIKANSPQKMPSRALPLEDVKEEHHEHLVNVHHVILMYKKLFYWFKQNKSIGHFHPCPSNYLLRFVSC